MLLKEINGKLLATALVIGQNYIIAKAFHLLNFIVHESPSFIGNLEILEKNFLLSPFHGIY